MSKILIALFTLVFLISTTYAEDQFSLKWRYRVDGEISVLTAADMDMDRLNEVIFSSGNNLYILDSNGNLKQNFRINSEGKISAIDISDLDNDGKNEIILGTGWMKTTYVNDEPFNLSGLIMVEKEKRLIKTVRNAGEIYLIDKKNFALQNFCTQSEFCSDSGKKNISKFQDVDGWVRSIDVSNERVVVGTGGSDIDFFEEVFYDSDGTKRRNYTDYTRWTGGIFIFNKTGLIGEYRADSTFSFISSDDVYKDQENEIIAGSGNTVYAFGKNFAGLWKYIAMGDITGIYVENLSSKDEKKIMAGFSSRSIDGIHVLNNDGTEFWTYRMPSRSRLSGSSVGNLDTGEDNEIVLASENKIYILDNSGRMKLEYWIGGGINRIYLTDLDEDKYMDLIISSRDTVTVYEVTEILIKRQLADGYYESAKELYVGRNYETAMGYIKNASAVYLEINDTGGISRANLLYYNILDGIKISRRIDADSLYANALSYYGFSNYTRAVDYAKKSIEIYLEINDTGGISRANSLITMIKNKTANITDETTTTTTTTPAQTNTTSDKIPKISSSVLVFVVILISLFVILIVIKIRRSGSGN